MQRWKEKKEDQEDHLVLDPVLVLLHGWSRSGVVQQREREENGRGTDLLPFIVNLVHASYEN